MSNTGNQEPDLCDIKHFADFADERQLLEGDKVRIDEILNTNIIVTGAEITRSKYDSNESGKCLKLQFQRDTTAAKEIIFTGSDVLIEQLEKYKDEIPFQTTIKKINRYYTLS